MSTEKELLEEWKRNNIAVKKALEKMGKELEKGALFFDKKLKDDVDKAGDEVRKTLLKYASYLKGKGKSK